MTIQRLFVKDMILSHHTNMFTSRKLLAQHVVTVFAGISPTKTRKIKLQHEFLAMKIDYYIEFLNIVEMT